MIDTLVLRLHGILSMKLSTLEEIKAYNNNTTHYAVDEHYQLYKAFLKYQGKYFDKYTLVSKEIESTELISEDDFLKLESETRPNKRMLIKSIMRFEDETRVKETNLRVNGKYSRPSSVSAVTFSINESAGYIDLNVSIPKYLYQHSLAEFIPQALSRDFNDNINLFKLVEQKKILHKRLLKFIDYFFDDMCKMFEIDVLPNKNYITIERVDICYNQYHQSKNHALNYLEHQKKILKRKHRANGQKHETFETSLTYHTSSGAYFKIYHKGTEYISSKHGDLKKHLDFNQKFIDNYLRSNPVIKKYVYENNFSAKYMMSLFEDKLKDKSSFIRQDTKKELNKTASHFKKIVPFKTFFLKEEMDKVLRYEISLRGDFFKYNYKRKVFRKYDKHYQEMQHIYKKVHAVYHSPQMDNNSLTKEEVKIHKALNKFYNRTISLTLSDSKVIRDYVSENNKDYSVKTDKYKLSHLRYKHSLLAEKDVGIFCEDFLTLCVDKFIQIVKQFQIKQLDAFETINSKIKEYNSKVDKRVSSYNKDYKFLTVNSITGKPIIKGNKIIVNATELLTAKQKREKKLKRVNVLRLLSILKEMEKGKSLHEIRKETGMGKSTYSRLKADLEMFEIFETTLQTKVNTNVELSYRQYYFNTKGLEYQNKFYLKPNMKRYG
ncbi:phage/plasmid replication protein [uncultured Winogradskyella sp.]|uniref:phage/plasmid replication domain-containing protein n=1 Tax=uncultured Winogradskyella sp. TaxID=395353 RepID=UPI002633832D|nr:phage/plasmid replication protein [uncultured Winogradskyella sp.]